ncbi:hypothetical protein AB0A70_29930 [Streptomyces morookaense]|nr:hypothetical protein [Streptomyces sp. ET3-23]
MHIGVHSGRRTVDTGFAPGINAVHRMPQPGQRAAVKAITIG